MWRICGEPGFLVLEGFLEADELAAAQEALWLHYPRPEEYFADPAAHGWLGTDQWAGIVGGPWRSWSLNRLAFHADLLDLAERFLGSADLRLYDAELWAKYAGAVDYDQRHHRDFVNHSLVVPKRSQPATQMVSWILLSDVGDEDGPTKIVPLSVGRERAVLAGPWGSRHHELPPRGDVRRRGGLDDRSRRNPVLFSVRRPSPWVAHDRRTVNPLCAPRRLRRVGTALDRQSRLGQRATRPDWFEIVERASPRERSVFGFPAPGDPYWDEQTLADTQTRYPEPDLTPTRQPAAMRCETESECSPDRSTSRSRWSGALARSRCSSQRRQARRRYPPSPSQRPRHRARRT